MSGMDESLRPKKSRITIFNEPVICQFCSKDVFIPYEVIVNVEQPGIGVRHVRYAAVCQSCGATKTFGDPSRFDAEKDTYIWALNQFSLSIKTFKVRIIFYVGKRKKEKSSTFINKLIQDLSAEIDSINENKGEVQLRLSFSNENDLQTNREIIMSLARRLKISIKEVLF